MKSGHSMQELISEIKTLAEKTASGQITRDELDHFVDTTSLLHHKAVILRYKAFENKVLGKNQPLELPEDNLEESATTQAAVEYNEPAVNMQAIENEIPEPVEVEQPVSVEEAAEEELQADLQLAHEEDEPTFDLFSLDLDKNEEISDAKPEEMPVMADEGQSSAMEIEEEETPETQPESVQPVAEAPQPVVSHQSEMPSALHAIYNRIDRPDDSLASRFPVNRIENLNVAFGFNERLQTINDLFGGSSETFSSAINEIQSAGSQNNARMIVSRYAQQNAWNASDDLAISFAKKVDQLYV